MLYAKQEWTRMAVMKNETKSCGTVRMHDCVFCCCCCAVVCWDERGLTQPFCAGPKKTELSHQQNREIAQHHYHRNNNNYISSTAAAGAPIGRFVRQTAEEVNRYASVFYHAAADAWEEQKERQRSIPRSNNHHRQYPPRLDRATAYLHEFGIPDDDPESGGRLLLDNEYTSFDETDAHHWNGQQQPNTPRQRRNGDNDGGDFVFLPNLRWRPNAEGWGAVANLDMYFSSLYSYFYHRGLRRIVAKGVVEMITLAFTMGLSVFLFLYVDWRALSTCIDEATCRSDFSGYMITRPFAQWTVWNSMVVLYCLLFTAYAVFAVLSFLRSVQDAFQAKWVFEERLGISARRLEGGGVDWDRDVVTKLLELQRSGEYRIAIHGQELDALVIAQRIMRKENFLVALFNRGLLDLSAPIPVFGDNLYCSSIEVRMARCLFSWSLRANSRRTHGAILFDSGACTFAYSTSCSITDTRFVRLFIWIRQPCGGGSSCAALHTLYSCPFYYSS